MKIMREWVVGALILMMCASALGQATGQVESVGFNNTYRPDCWTPMVVRLAPQTNDAGTYQIQVWQHDLDGDRAIYWKQITLNGADAAKEQRFWMYFLPQPINKGLPDPSNGGTLKDLQRELQVFLCAANGKQITQLPITSTLANIDPYRDYSQNPRGSKLILAVSDGGSLMAWHDYQYAVGINEDVEVVNLQPKDLPEDPIGYEAVDSIVWFDADPADLDKGGQHKMQALQDYVRFGGQLVICQPTTEWEKTLGFGDLLPVTVEGVQLKSNLEPLRSMAQPREPDPVKLTLDPWNRPTGPFQFARATAKPQAVVDQWIDWKEDGSYSDASPYLVRKAVGLGQVTWVAQDLGNPAISARATAGWPYVWDRVFGWNNDSYVPPANSSNVSKDDPDVLARTDLYRPGNPQDLGTPLVNGLNLDSRGAWLIFVAMAFFVVYGIVAGPGGYLYLAANKRAALSWYFFAASGIAATAVTVLMVKVVLHYPPQIRHISIVRIAPGQPALIYSRFGLYIPRDGDQSIELGDTVNQSVSYLAAFDEHPELLGDASEFPSPADYTVPVRDLDSVDPPEITVPYRSSEKEFASKWIGEFKGKFSGNVKLDAENSRVGLSGSLTNETTQDFADVYLAFHVKDTDHLLYIPKWPRGTTYDLAKDLGRPVYVGHINGSALLAEPGEGKVISDEIGSSANKAGTSRDMHWIGFWYAKFFRGSNLSLGGASVEDDNFTYVFPMLSLFDRLPPSWNRPPDVARQSGGTSDRFEMLRHGGRILNVSGSVMAGQLVILASQVRGGTTVHPLPEAVNVDGDRIDGDGTVFYQFILPIDRGDVDQPTTQPAD